MLVVRESIRKEVHQKLMDNDLSSHSIMLRTVKNSRQSMILINGHNPSVQVIENFNVNYLYLLFFKILVIMKILA